MLMTVACTDKGAFIRTKLFTHGEDAVFSCFDHSTALFQLQLKSLFSTALLRTPTSRRGFSP